MRSPNRIVAAVPAVLIGCAVLDLAAAVAVAVIVHDLWYLAIGVGAAILLGASGVLVTRVGQLRALLVRQASGFDRLSARLDQLSSEIAGVGARITALSPPVDPWSEASVERVVERVGRSPKGIEQHIRQSTSRDVSALLALHAMLPVHTEVPSPGGWAATPQTILALVGIVSGLPRDSLIVECGSGTSSVWLGIAARSRGDNVRVVSLEQDEAFAAETVRALRRNGVDDLVEVRVAPLADQVVDGDAVLWYSASSVKDLTGVGLLFVDGPPGKSSSAARWPAYPMLRSALSQGARVVLDDTDRPDERETVSRWIADEKGPGRLHRDRGLDRATVLVFSQTDSDGR